MSQTGQEIIDRIGKLIGDPRHKEFIESSKLAEANEIIRNLISSFTLCYSRETDIPIMDGERVYDFPDDMLEIQSMNLTDIEGSLIIGRTYEEVIKNNLISGVDTTGVFNGFSLDQGAKYSFTRGAVGDNQFRFIPKFQTSTSSGTVTTEDDLPDSMNEDEFFVDSGDSSKVYICDESYSDLTAILTVTAANRPGVADLVFTADNVGTENIKVAIVDGGASGVAALVITGTGVRTDPYIYTFTTYDNDSSNDSIITLVGADANLDASGADATDSSSYTAFSATSLVNPGWAKLTVQVIHLIYAAVIPDLASLTDTLNDAIPSVIRNSDCIARLAAANLFEIQEKPDFAKADRNRSLGTETINRASRHKNRMSQPQTMKPG